MRLNEQWMVEFEEWSQRDLSREHYIYLWADGFNVNVRLDDDADKKRCILVLMGATAGVRRELIALQDGYRGSEQCWSELLLDAKQRGMPIEPKLAVGDGALGVWAALRKLFPETSEGCCWFHKSGNVPSKMPKVSKSVACYVRVSTVGQNEAGQKAEIQRWLRGNGIDTLCACCHKGLRVASVTQQIDFSGTVGQIIAAVLLGVAQMEQETRRERQAVGIAVAKKQRKYQGRRSGTTKPAPKRAMELRENGLKADELATALGVSRNTVFRYFREAS